MKTKKKITKNSDSFLEQVGILEEINFASAKNILSSDLQTYMEVNKKTQLDISKKLKITRAELKKLLDPNNFSVTLLTCYRAASLLGKQITMNLTDLDVKIIKVKPKKVKKIKAK